MIHFLIACLWGIFIGLVVLIGGYVEMQVNHSDGLWLWLGAGLMLVSSGALAIGLVLIFRRY